MALQLEDYAVVGNTRSAAVIGVDGSVDWLCLPRFDSGACFAALLGGPEHGRWQLAPAGELHQRRHRYQGDSLVLETEFGTRDGKIRVVDCMPLPKDRADRATRLIRVVEGIGGRVPVHSELAIRFDYGHVVPWLHDHDAGMLAAAGPDCLLIGGDVRHRRAGGDLLTADFTVGTGERVALWAAWSAVGDPLPGPSSAGEVDHARTRWQEWADRCRYRGRYREAVVRSLLLLKCLSYAPSGGIVAAATASLPEDLGGVRNWDYRYCWLRDATYTLLALLDAGYTEEARAWRGWLLRALAGRPEQMQIMYGIDGRRRLTELELDWLPGYEQSRPVRIGNAAHAQFQLDVYGELMDALHQARSHDIAPEEHAWEVQRVLLDFLQSHWDDPDNGIWEVRGRRRHFVHSKVMAWAAMDRAVKGVERFGLDGPLERWRALRQQIHDEVCARGYDADRDTFTQFYGSRGLDAALLLLPSVGFLPPDDPRITGTVAAVERELSREGFIRRYDPDADGDTDGLPGSEGAFLPCTLWLADAYLLQGRRDEAREVFERVLGVRNDTGLLTEEYDVTAHRLVGNLPQAFSHVPLVNTAISLDGLDGDEQAGAIRGRSRTGSRTGGS
ncbi:MAG TPA: glycoside hydrolase family 15 protein [Kineosporiaceae bacterium]|nr:glycoside hydrolase family 15 protein [Kineosporiaceae bacterium]